MAGNRPLDIFTVNYDITIEQFCNVYQKEYTDGFGDYWNKKNLDRIDVDIRLFKLHGSIDWFRTDRENYVKVLVKSDKPEIDLIFGEKARALILYPMRKWDYVEPLLEMMMRLKYQLENALFVFVVGYSFRDEHLTRIFWDAAKNNTELFLILIDPAAYQIYEEKLRYYPSTGPVRNRVPSSLEGRVLPLAYKFEEILPQLRNRHFTALHRAVYLERDQKIAEELGSKPDWSEAFEKFADCEFLAKVNSIIGKHTFANLRSFATWEQKVSISYKMFLTAYNANDDSAEGWLQILASELDFVHPGNFTVEVDRQKQLLQLFLKYPAGGIDTIDRLSSILDELASFGKLRRDNMLEKADPQRISLIVDAINDLWSYLSWWESDRMTLDFFVRNQETKYHDLIQRLLPSIEHYRAHDDRGDKTSIEEITAQITQSDISEMISEKGLTTLLNDERTKIFRTSSQDL